MAAPQPPQSFLQPEPLLEYRRDELCAQANTILIVVPWQSQFREYSAARYDCYLNPQYIDTFIGGK